jgi:plasmid stability protein
MATLTIRDVDPAVVEWLKRQAATHQRSLEAEVRSLLDREARQRDMAAWLRRVDKLRRRVPPLTAGQPTAADLVRESRDGTP